MRRRAIVHDFDAFWKEALDEFLEPFLALVAPRLHATIDWTQPVVSLDKELHALFPEGRRGRRFVDKLFGLTRRSGEQIAFLIHVEVQTEPDEALPWRMFEYRVRVALKRRKPVVSLAVLADDDPRFRPTAYQERMPGNELRFRYHMVKVLDYRPRVRSLLRSSNPFALLFVAWLRTRASKPGLRRLHFKRQLLRVLRQQGHPADRAVKLFWLLDQLMLLPEEQQEQFVDEAIRLEEGSPMRIVTPTELLGQERGEKRGKELGATSAKADAVVQILTARFGKVSATVAARIRQIESIDELDGLIRNAATCVSLREFTRGSRPK